MPGACVNPKGHLVNSYLSVGVMKADLGLALAESSIWWYPLHASKPEYTLEPFSLA